MGRSYWFVVRRDSKEGSQLGFYSSINLWNNPYRAVGCMDLLDGEKKLVTNSSSRRPLLTVFNRERSIKLNLSLPRLSGKCLTSPSHESPKFHCSLFKSPVI